MPHFTNKIPLLYMLSDGYLNRSVLEMNESCIDIFLILYDNEVACNRLYVIGFRIEVMCMFVSVCNIRKQIGSCAFLIPVLCQNNNSAAGCIYVLTPAVILSQRNTKKKIPKQTGMIRRTAFSVPVYLNKVIRKSCAESVGTVTWNFGSRCVRGVPFPP